MQRTLATNGGVRPSAGLADDEALKSQRARAALDGVEHEIADLEAANAPADKLAPFRQQLAELRTQLKSTGGPVDAGSSSGPAAGTDLPDLLRSDVAKSGDLQARIAGARKDLAESESGLAKDALHRLDLRLSRLLRRARLGRIEHARAWALEVEVERYPSRLTCRPQDAVPTRSRPPGTSKTTKSTGPSKATTGPTSTWAARASSELGTGTERPEARVPKGRRGPLRGGWPRASAGVARARRVPPAPYYFWICIPH